MAEAKSTTASKPDTKPTIAIKRSADGKVSTVTVNGEPVLGFKAHVAAASDGATSHDVLILSVRLDRVDVTEVE